MVHSIVGGCSGGGPREEQEVRERLPQGLSYLRLQCLLTIWTPFFKAAHWPIWLGGEPKILLWQNPQESLNNKYFLSVHWPPVDYFSQLCFLYNTAMQFPIAERRQAAREKIELINPAFEGTMSLKCESCGVKSWFISLITPLWSLYLIPLDLKRKQISRTNSSKNIWSIKKISYTFSKKVQLALWSLKSLVLSSVSIYWFSFWC